MYLWLAPPAGFITRQNSIQPDLEVHPVRILDALDRDLLERLVLDPGEAAASRIADPEKDREYQNLLFHYGEYRDGWLA